VGHDADRVVTAVVDLDDVEPGTPPIPNGATLVYDVGINAFRLVLSGSGGDLNYLHTQNIAATTWTVTHNLGKKPSVTVVDSGGSVVIGAVTHVNTNQLQIVFTAAFSGVAHCN